MAPKPSQDTTTRQCPNPCPQTQQAPERDKLTAHSRIHSRQVQTAHFSQTHTHSHTETHVLAGQLAHTVTRARTGTPVHHALPRARTCAVSGRTQTGSPTCPLGPTAAGPAPQQQHPQEAGRGVPSQTGHGSLVLGETICWPGGDTVRLYRSISCVKKDTLLEEVLTLLTANSVTLH